jgi:hypothetical protein
MRMRGWAWGLALVFVLAPAAGAQSLGEAAAREKAKREKRGKATPSPSYTDSDLKDPSKPEKDKEKDGGENTSGTPSGVTNTGSGEGGSRPVSTVTEGASGYAPSVSASDEEIWRARAHDQREAIRSAEKSIQAAQDRLNALMSDRDVTMTQDPNRLQTIETRKNEARAAIDAGRLSLAEAQKALQDFEAEARRNNVPPGWLREP